MKSRPKGEKAGKYIMGLFEVVSRYVLASDVWEAWKSAARTWEEGTSSIQCEAVRG